MSCILTPELEYSIFCNTLAEKALEKRIPLFGSIELTYRCNVRCVHCYLGDNRQGVEDQQEMTTQEVMGLMDQMVEMGTLWLCITGGEPLVRPDFLDIYMYGIRRGLLLTVFTNGTLLTPKIADVLAEYRPFLTEVSLYGATAATYERVTGIPGSYERCLRGIRLLLERNIPLNLKSPLMTLNYHELPQMQAMADAFGVDFRFDTTIQAGIWQDNAPKTLRLSIQEAMDAETQSPGRMKKWAERIDASNEPSLFPESSYRCDAGLRSFHIDPYSNLGMCISDRRPAYNIRNGSFAEGWNQAIPPVRLGAALSNEAAECQTCHLRAICGECPGRKQTEGIEENQKFEYLCTLAHLREQHFHHFVA